MEKQDTQTNIRAPTAYELDSLNLLLTPQKQITMRKWKIVYKVCVGLQNILIYV